MLTKMWAALGEDTIRCLANSYRTLAMLCDAAYTSALGHDFTGPIDPRDLRAIYEDHDFLPSKHLANWVANGYRLPL